MLSSNSAFAAARWSKAGAEFDTLFGLLPVGMRDGTSYLGVEKDSVTARIARLLYPNARIIEGGFEGSKPF
jgi:hypothetical protein